MKLKCLGIQNFGSFFRKTFVDQINHNIKTPNLELLLNDSVKLIVLIRNPIDSIESIIKLTKDYYQAWDREKASKYYCERLEYLSDICIQKKKENILIIDSDQLILNSDETLTKLSQFLEVKSKLTGNYRKFSFTGIKGDPDGNISSGKILLNQKITQDYDPADPAYIAYRTFKENHLKQIST